MSATAASAVPPGRSCPLDYVYDPAVFAPLADMAAETLYVVGGLYGNLAAAQAVERLARAERDAVTVVFNGDFATTPSPHPAVYGQRILEGPAYRVVQAFPGGPTDCG